MTLLFVTIILAAIFACVERMAIDSNINNGLFADLDHNELTAWRVISWMACALLLIAMDAMKPSEAVIVVPACMSVFASAHRIVINVLRNRPMWYLGVGSLYDRKLIESVLRMKNDHEDLRFITSAQHYNRIMDIPSYRETVRGAGLFAYGFEATVVIATLVVRC